MAKRVEVVQVGAASYQISTLDTDIGIDLYEELLRIFGPALREAIVSDGGKRDAQSIALVTFFESINSMPPGMMKRLKNIFVPTCKLSVKIDGKAELWVEMNAEIVEQQFAGDMPHLTAWLIACLKVNFSNFFSAFSGASQAAKAPATPA